jgi:branched-chain amino acid transport system ATP-binding protein
MTATAEPLLAVRGVTTFYGKIQALHGVDIDVNEGEIVALIGANGAGKSTLMMTICGNPAARDGSITYEGRDITRLPTHEIARLRVAQSPEGRRIFPRMTVLENLQMGASLDKLAHFEQDEPSLGLAPLIVKQIFDVIRTLNTEEKLTVFIVEQNAYHALSLAHRGYVMVNGRVTMSGTGRELLERPEVRAAYLEGGRH